jgi:hypothetical protein
MNSVSTSQIYTKAVADATRDFLRTDLKSCFHMDDNVLELLDMPTDQDALWKSQVEAVNSNFPQAQGPNLDLLLTLQNSKSGTSDREKEMYKPLVCWSLWGDSWVRLTEQQQEILNHIGGSPGMESARQWVTYGTHGPRRDCGDMDFNLKPDLALLEKEKMQALDVDKGTYWRQVSATVEVKSDLSHGPQPGDNILNGNVLEAIDHMRMHLAMRPFQRWVFGLLFCGTNFYVLYLDRAGGAITEPKNIKTDFPLFVRVVLHMTKGMTRQQFGQDPDVQFGQTFKAEDIERGEADKGLRSYNRWHETHPWDKEMPVYTFPGCSGCPRFQTIGTPIFVVYGLLGRGTSIWTVHPEQNQDAPKQIMKYSWRSVEKRSESEIYNDIQSIFPDGIGGVCKFVDGTDAAWNSTFQPVLSDQLGEEPAINPRRTLLSNKLSTVDDRIVHRLILDTRGQPLNAFRNAAHLMQVLKSAIRGEISLP